MKNGSKSISKLVIAFFVFLLFFYVNSKVTNAYIETKTGSSSASKVSGFMPTSGKIMGTREDLKKYFSVSDAKLAEIKTCNDKKNEAASYYNSQLRNNCLQIINNGGYWDYQSDSWKTSTDKEKSDCQAKENLLKEFSSYYEEGYFDFNFDCAKGMIAASYFGLGDGYVDKNAIRALVGDWNWSEYSNSGISGGYQGNNKICFRREVPYWYHTNCFELFAQSGVDFTCSHQNIHSQSFEYQANQGGIWGSVANKSGLHKCEEIRVKFSFLADFSAALNYTQISGGQMNLSNYYNRSDMHVPPTNVANCANQGDCLNLATEYEVAPGAGKYAKGIQRVPADFVKSVENSLSGSGEGLKCSQGICTATQSKKYSLSVNIPETSYYGQCRGASKEETINGEKVVLPDVTINTDEVKIPAATSTLDINVQNRPPVSTVTFEKKYMSEGETTKVYCDVIDPDSCSDKIVKIKWKCMDSQGKTDNCFFLDNNSIFKQGELYKEITPANPYRDTVDLKLNKKETYAVTCEAWDNDNANTLSGAGINSIKVTDPVCIADGTCNGKCPGDPDCGVIPAGSCYITRIKPAFDIKKIKPNTKVTFEAKLFGSVAPTKYTWFCDKNDTTQEEITSADKTINHTCTNYTLDNQIYEPKVVVTYSDGTTKECINNEGTAVTTDGVAPSQVGFCTVVPDEGGTDNSTCGDETNAKFKVYTNQDLNNPTYEWSNCPGSQNQPNVTCNYKTTQLSEKFTPSLIIKDGGETIKCPSNTSVTLYKEAACKVLSRVKGTNNEYAEVVKSANVKDVIESKIERKCLDPKETVTWSLVGGKTLDQDNNTFNSEMIAPGNFTVTAKSKVGEKEIDCKASSIEVKQKIQEGI